MHLYLGEDTCKLCRAAQSKYGTKHKQLKELGLPTTSLIPVQGTVRRLQGLMWMGWPVNYILDQAGVKRRSIVRFEETERIHEEDAKKIAAVYKKLAMTWADPKYGLRMKEITRAKRYARKRGYVSPLAWEDIENEEFNWSKHIWAFMSVEEREAYRRQKNAQMAASA